jgi:hypothetical protein
VLLGLLLRLPLQRWPLQVLLLLRWLHIRLAYARVRLLLLRLWGRHQSQWLSRQGHCLQLLLQQLQLLPQHGHLLLQRGVAELQL